MSTANPLPRSQYFTLERLAEGVFAAVVIPGTGAWGNAGIIDLGGSALVFDTFLTPAPARELRAAAETLSGSPARYVVNSHYHMDHTYGNAEFPDALIVATETTRDLIAERGGRLLEQVRSNPAALSELEAEMRAEPDAARRADKALELREWRALDAAAATMTLRLPDVTFAERLTLHGTCRTAVLQTYGGGHTPSDVFLHLPADRIAFMGDLVPVDTHPSFAGDANEWQRILERVERLDIAAVVPGHGTIGTLADVITTRQYIADLQALANDVAQAGGTEDDAAALPIPVAYADWAAPSVFPANMRFLYRHTTSPNERSHE